MSIARPFCCVKLRFEMDLTRLLSTDENGADGYASDGATRWRMDISRLLSDTQQGPVDVDAVANASTPTKSRGPKRPQRVRNRVNPVHELRAQVEALECALANWPIVLRDSDPSQRAIQDQENQENDGRPTVPRPDHADKHMQQFLRRMMQLFQDAQHYERERTELLRLLKPYRAHQAATRKLMLGAVIANWQLLCLRWAAYAKEFFVKFTYPQLMEMQNKALRAIKHYKCPVVESLDGPVFVGWIESKIEGVDNGIYIRARKTYKGMDMLTVANRVWKVFKSADKWSGTIYHRNLDYYHNILQKPNKNIRILQTVQKLTGFDIMFHSLYLLFRVQTDTSYTIVFRVIDSPMLKRAMRNECVYDAYDFFWLKWEKAGPDEYVLSYDAHIVSGHPGYAKWWIQEALIMIVRAERIVKPDDSYYAETMNV